MPHTRSTQYDDMDQSFWDGKHEYRKVQSAKDRCKERKQSTIRKGIEDYFENNRLRRNMADSFDGLDDWDDFDDLTR